MALSQKNNDGDDSIVSEINMTPLIDVMLVLLIIFMVSSSAALESGLDVNVPESSAVSEKPNQMVIVSLSKEGTIAVSGKVVEKANLREEITKALAEMKTDSIILEGDGNSSLTSAFEVMDIGRNAGAKNFSIAARQKGN
jgi:biopolymer transport protein ExbD